MEQCRLVNERIASNDRSTIIGGLVDLITLLRSLVGGGHLGAARRDAVSETVGWIDLGRLMEVSRADQEIRGFALEIFKLMALGCSASALPLLYRGGVGVYCIELVGRDNAQLPMGILTAVMAVFNCFVKDSLEVRCSMVENHLLAALNEMLVNRGRETVQMVSAILPNLFFQSPLPARYLGQVVELLNAVAGILGDEENDEVKVDIIRTLALMFKEHPVPVEAVEKLITSDLFVKSIVLFARNFTILHKAALQYLASLLRDCNDMVYNHVVMVVANTNIFQTIFQSRDTQLRIRAIPMVSYTIHRLPQMLTIGLIQVGLIHYLSEMFNYYLKSREPFGYLIAIQRLLDYDKLYSKETQFIKKLFNEANFPDKLIHHDKTVQDPNLVRIIKSINQHFGVIELTDLKKSPTKSTEDLLEVLDSKIKLLKF